MKAITIIQPWATLIAIGAKQYETRSWSTKYRGKIAIHAGKKMDMTALLDPVIRDALLRNGICDWTTLPYGMVVATANLTECWEVIGIADVPVKQTSVLSVGNKMFGIAPDAEEYHFGDFSDGRYAWELSDVLPLLEPIPAKGQQGLWNWSAGERLLSL